MLIRTVTLLVFLLEVVECVDQMEFLFKNQELCGNIFADPQWIPVLDLCELDCKRDEYCVENDELTQKCKKLPADCIQKMEQMQLMTTTTKKPLRRQVVPSTSTKKPTQQRVATMTTVRSPVRRQAIVTPTRKPIRRQAIVTPTRKPIRRQAVVSPTARPRHVPTATIKRLSRRRVLVNRTRRTN